MQEEQLQVCPKCGVSYGHSCDDDQRRTERLEDQSECDWQAPARETFYETHERMTLEDAVERGLVVGVVVRAAGVEYLVPPDVFDEAGS